MGVSITRMNAKFLQQACWEASHMHLADIREHMEGASDRDLCALEGMRSVAVSATAMTLLSRYEADGQAAVAAVNSVIDERGPIEAIELAGVLYQASAIHATAMVSLAGDKGDPAYLPEELSEELGRAMRVALDEGRDGKACAMFELGVGSRAQSWSDYGQWAALFVMPDQVAEVAEKEGIAADKETCETVAWDAAMNIYCNREDYTSVRELVRDQIVAELKNVHGELGEQFDDNEVQGREKEEFSDVCADDRLASEAPTSECLEHDDGISEIGGEAK